MPTPRRAVVSLARSVSCMPEERENVLWAKNDSLSEFHLQLYRFMRCIQSRGSFSDFHSLESCRRFFALLSPACCALESEFSSCRATEKPQWLGNASLCNLFAGQNTLTSALEPFRNDLIPFPARSSSETSRNLPKQVFKSTAFDTEQSRESLRTLLHAR